MESDKIIPVYIQDSTEQIGFIKGEDSFTAGVFYVPLHHGAYEKEERLEIFLVKSPIGLMGIIQNMSINDITRLDRQTHIKLTEYARGALAYGGTKNGN